jgi:hypothetical protein
LEVTNGRGRLAIFQIDGALETAPEEAANALCKHFLFLCNNSLLVGMQYPLPHCNDI